jgi:hypothetical protein
VAQKVFVDTGQVSGTVEAGAYLPDNTWTLMAWGWMWDEPPTHPDRVVVADEHKALGGPNLDSEGFYQMVTTWQDESGMIRCWVLGDDGQP